MEFSLNFPLPTIFNPAASLNLVVKKTQFNLPK